MQEIFEHFGKALISLSVMTLLIGLLFHNASDAAGNRGIIAIVKAQIQTVDETEWEFSTYAAESQKQMPVFNTKVMQSCLTGSYLISELVTALDYAGNEIPVKVLSVSSPNGTVQENTPGVDDMVCDFSVPGIYKIRMIAVDEGNRDVQCILKIPVNKR